MANTAENARLAKEILDNPIFNQAFADLKKDLLDRWSASDPFDKEGREAAFVFYRTMDMLHSKLSGYVNKHIAEIHNAELLAARDEYSRA